LARAEICLAFWHYSRAGKRPVDFYKVQATNTRSLLVHLNHPDIKEVLVTAEQIQARIAELAAPIDEFYKDKNVLLLGILKGAVPFMADLARAMQIPTKQDWMAVSSYGSGTVSSGVVRILKDLDTDVKDRNVLIVEDIIDSGLTLSWLTANLKARGAASVEIVALLRKPDAAKVEIAVRWVGFDIPNEFVVGYGLDYNEQYRSLDGVGILSPSVYS
jgi:hypoxanthine phosphoribosyltransferase